MDLAVRPLGTITCSVMVPGLPSWPWMAVIAYCEQQQAVIEVEAIQLELHLV